MQEYLDLLQRVKDTGKQKGAGICSWGLSDLPANAPDKEQI